MAEEHPDSALPKQKDEPEEKMECGVTIRVSPDSAEQEKRMECGVTTGVTPDASETKTEGSDRGTSTSGSTPQPPDGSSGAEGTPELNPGIFPGVATSKSAPESTAVEKPMKSKSSKKKRRSVSLKRFKELVGFHGSTKRSASESAGVPQEFEGSQELPEKFEEPEERPQESEVPQEYPKESEEPQEFSQEAAIMCTGESTVPSVLISPCKEETAPLGAKGGPSKTTSGIRRVASFLGSFSKAIGGRSPTKQDKRALVPDAEEVKEAEVAEDILRATERKGRASEATSTSDATRERILPHKPVKPIFPEGHMGDEIYTDKFVKQGGRLSLDSTFSVVMTDTTMVETSGSAPCAAGDESMEGVEFPGGEDHGSRQSSLGDASSLEGDMDVTEAPKEQYLGEQESSERKSK